MKRRVWTLTASLLAIVLAGCAPQSSLKLDADEDSLPVCDDLSTVFVEDLGSAPVTCKITGGSLTFPDGTVLPVSEFTGNAERVDGSSGYRHLWVDVGDFGIVAGMRDGSCTESQVWGADEAKSRVREAFGDDWPCDWER
jgi:hypothetical protein